MAFDGFTLKAVVQELNSSLVGGKITKIHQPTSEEIILGVYSNGTNYALSCNTSFSAYSLHLTTHSKPNPLSAPNFCMLLRKHLIGFKIKNIEMSGLERIAILNLEGYNELNDLVTLKLIIELMGKHSNIILVDYNNIIIDSLKHLNTFSGSYRNILPNTSYQFPESNKYDICKISAEFYNTISQEDKCLPISTYFIEHFTGTSKVLLDYAIKELKISEDLNLENFTSLLAYLQNLIKKIETIQVECAIFNQDYVLTENNDISNLDVNFFLDDYYYQKEQLEEFTQYRNTMLAFIMKRTKKIVKKLNGVNSKIQECSRMDEYKLYGELLTSYLYQISSTHTDKIILENYYNENSPITIPLDISLSPADNAKKYFKKYHKLKNTIDIVSKQKVELEKEIDYLESIVYELQLAKNIQEINHIYQEMEQANLFSKKTVGGNKSKNFKIGNSKSIKTSTNINKKSNSKVKVLSDFLSYTIDGFTVLVGKNNQENDYLTLKIAKENDIWFHVKDMQGSHVILVTDKKSPSQETINKVASISAYHSKAKISSNVPVDYTLVKYVKKPSKAKPGMVIYTDQKTVNVQPHIS